MTRREAATLLHQSETDIWLIRELGDGSVAVYVHDFGGIVAHHVRSNGTLGEQLRLTPEQFLVERQLALEEPLETAA